MPITLGRYSYYYGDSNPHDSVVVVGNYTGIATGVLFLGKSSHYSQANRKCVTNHGFVDWVGPKNSDEIRIGSDVWIGWGAVIVPRIFTGITIGHGSIIGASCVVTKDVPPYALVVGNPQRIVRYRFDEGTIAKLLQIRWWDWPDDVIQSRKADFQDVESFVGKYHVTPGGEEETMADGLDSPPKMV